MKRLYMSEKDETCTKKISEDSAIGETAGGFSGEGKSIGLFPGTALYTLPKISRICIGVPKCKK